MTAPAKPHFINRRRIMEKCNIRGCKKPAEFEVILYDVYVHDERVFFERDFTCPFLCGKHMAENESQASGTRAPRESVRYPYGNQQGALGFTIYRPLKDHA
jgi:hypothetical protein